MNYDPFLGAPTMRRVLCGRRELERFTRFAFDLSTPYSVVPLPHDTWEVTFKAEVYKHLWDDMGWPEPQQ